MNIPKGPIYKEILTAVEDAQLEEAISAKTEAIAFVKGRFFKSD